MALNRASFYGNNYGSPDSGHQFGPYNLGSCTKLLHVTCVMSTTPILSGSWANNFVQDFASIWGVQWVPHGDSPLALPGLAYDSQFLWAEMYPKGVMSNFSWDFASPDGALSTCSTVYNEWYGQLPIRENIDLYVTTGDITGGGNTWQSGFLMRVVNTT